jgi:hypothetical protein
MQTDRLIYLADHQRYIHFAEDAEAPRDSCGRCHASSCQALIRVVHFVIAFTSTRALLSYNGRALILSGTGDLTGFAKRL